MYEHMLSIYVYVWYIYIYIYMGSTVGSTLSFKFEANRPLTKKPSIL